MTVQLKAELNEMVALRALLAKLDEVEALIDDTPMEDWEYQRLMQRLDEMRTIVAKPLTKNERDGL